MLTVLKKFLFKISLKRVKYLIGCFVGQKIECVSFIQALAAHNLEQTEEITVSFYTNNNTPINSEDLFDFIGQKINCGCFYVELKISGETYKTINKEVSIFFPFK